MITFNVKIKTVSLACIGWSYPAAFGPDVSFAKKAIVTRGRNTRYELYVPGSSLKGALRSSASRISLTYGFSSCGEVRPELIEKAHGKGGGPCDVCKLFGEPKSGTPGLLFISDLNPTTNNVKPSLVTRIRLDDSTLRAAEGALFRVEYSPPAVEFNGTATLNTSEEENLIGLLLLSFAELRLGRIGRNTIVDVKLEETEELRKAAGGRWSNLLNELSRWVWYT